MMNLILLAINCFLAGAVMVGWVVDKQQRLSLGLIGLGSLFGAAGAALKLLAEMGTL